MKLVIVDGLTPDQIKDIQSHINGLKEGDETYNYPENGPGWVCFHCGERFITPKGAELHFGKTPSSKPVCIEDNLIKELDGVVLSVDEKTSLCNVFLPTEEITIKVPNKELPDDLYRGLGIKIYLKDKNVFIEKRIITDFSKTQHIVEEMEKLIESL